MLGRLGRRYRKTLNLIDTEILVMHGHAQNRPKKGAGHFILGVQSIIRAKASTASGYKAY